MKKSTTIWIDNTDEKITVERNVTDGDEAAVLLGYSNYEELHMMHAPNDDDSPLNFVWEDADVDGCD